jgi:predicted nucleotidyltransferase
MITESDEKIILQYAKKYNVSSIILFGSSLENGKKANDIDLGVKGIEPQLFLKFYAELYKYLSKPVHLIDISKKSLFNDLVEETGAKIYG